MRIIDNWDLGMEPLEDLYFDMDGTGDPWWASMEPMFQKHMKESFSHAVYAGTEKRIEIQTKAVMHTLLLILFANLVDEDE